MGTKRRDLDSRYFFEILLTIPITPAVIIDHNISLHAEIKIYFSLKCLNRVQLSHYPI